MDKDAKIPGKSTLHWRQSTIRTGDLLIDIETRAASADDKRVRLTGKEYCILELFSVRKGAIVTKRMLLDHLYGGLDEPELKIIDVFVCHRAKSWRRRRAASTISRRSGVEVIGCTIRGKYYRCPILNRRSVQSAHARQPDRASYQSSPRCRISFSSMTTICSASRPA
jgi:hypothetical protein